ncbi:hypothetical protein N7453_004574 [Penicillium expansum]|nr:hypothetical protein N7453_004574 [Penicillium expansum]
MAFGFKKVLIIGATSGIRKTLANRVHNLDEIVQQFGSDKPSAKSFDTPKFASEIISKDPDLDCIFVNSSIQRPFDFSKPETVDLDILDQELITNYISTVRITKSIPPTLAEPEDCNSHRILNVANGSCAHDAMPKLWRFQGCSAPFRHCPPHSAWNLIGMPLQEFVDED